MMYSKEFRRFAWQLAMLLTVTACDGTLSAATPTPTPTPTPSPSPSPSPARNCDVVVAPGSDIQAVVNQAGAGGTVCLTKGTWTLTGTLTLRSDMTLAGAGSSTIIQGPNTVYNWPLISVPKNATPQNVTVSDLVIDGRIPKTVAFDPNNGYANSIGLYFYDPMGPGKNLRFSRLEVHNTSEALHAKGYDGIVISDCYFHHNGVMLSTTLGNHNFYLLRDSHVVISNVRAVGSWTGDGLHLRDMTGTTTIKDSTFVGNYRFGIHVQLSGNTTTNIVASNNDISYNGSKSVYLPTYNGLNMTGLDMETITGTVSGNVAVGNTGSGILSRNGTGTISGNIAAGNIAAGNIAAGNANRPQIDSYHGLTIGPNLLLGPVSDGSYQVVSGLGGALTALGTVVGSSTAPKPYTRSLSQKWTFANRGSGEYAISSAAGNLALTAVGSPSGANVVLTAPSGADSQVWRAIPAGGGHYRLCAKSTPGVCLNSVGALVRLTAYASSGSERWGILPP